LLWKLELGEYMPKPQRAALVEGPVGRTLVRLTIPMIVGIMGMVAFNLIDTYFVGLLGTEQLAAMSFTFPVVMVINSLALGLGAGASAVISRAIGTGDQREVRRLTTDALSLSLIIVAIFVVIGLLTIRPVFTLLGATDELMPMIEEYMIIWYLGMIFVVVPMVGNNAIRATGDTKTPSFVMLVAVFVNTTLDPLLIFGLGPFPRLGLTGAAIATVITRAMTFAVALWVLYYRDRMITFARPSLAIVFHSWKRILFIGIPASAANMILPIGAGVVTSLVAGYGAAAVAGFGVATRIDMFALTVVFALSSVLGPFIGQNWGAGKIDRVQLGVRYSEYFSLMWGLAMALFFGLIAPYFARLVHDDPVVIATIALYLRLVPISYGMQGLVRLANYSLNVLNRPLQAASLTLIQMFALYIPLAILGGRSFGIAGIFGGISVAHILAGVIAYLWLQKVLRDEGVSGSVRAGGIMPA
jgi:putative MATE family efflux protein